MHIAHTVRVPPRRSADNHQSKILQLVTSPSPAWHVSTTVYPNSTQQDAPVDSLYIEDTDDWLGCPTPLETCRQKLRLYENEFEELNRQLREERERIFKLVEMNTETNKDRDVLRKQLLAAQADVNRLQSQTTVLTSDLRVLNDIKRQNVYLFEENQRLLREARERES